jgi:hypothetical protein
LTGKDIFLTAGQLELPKEKRTKMAIDTKNYDWNIVPLPDGTFPNDQVTHCLLMDIRELLKTIKKIAVFFTTVFIISAVLALFGAIVTHL